MGEREGTPKDFLHLLGRGPAPEAEQKPDESPAHPAETEPEEDALIAALAQPKSSWAEAFVRALHPPDEGKG